MNSFFKKINLIILIIVVFLAPALSYAQDTGAKFCTLPEIKDIESGVDFIGAMVSCLTPILITGALVLFIIGVLQFVIASGQGSDLGDSKQKILYSIIALFVILSVWGLVSVVSNTLGIGSGGFFGPQ